MANKLDWNQFASFDQVQQDQSKPFDWDQFASLDQVEEMNKPSYLGSVVKAPIKGALKGAAETITSPLFSAIPASQMVNSYLQSKPELATREAREETLNKLLPTQDTFGLNVLERAGKIAPYVATSAASVPSFLLGTGLGALGGESAKELGANEFVQGLAEIPGQIGAGMFGSKMIPRNATEAAIMNEANAAGITQKELAPLLKSEVMATSGAGTKVQPLTGVEIASNVADKGSKTQRILDESNQAIKRTLDKLEKSPEATKNLPGNAAQKFIEETDDILSKLPSELREIISKDYNDLINSGMKGTDLLNFYRDINHYVSRYPGLGQLKDPLMKAMHDVSDKFGKGVTFTNNLFRRYYETAGRLRGGVDVLNEAGEKIVKQAFKGSAPGFKEMLFGILGGYGARKLVTDPRYHNILGQMKQAADQGKWGVVTRLAQSVSFDDEGQRNPNP